MTQDTDYAWAAGIIDGEGSFWIARSVVKGVPRFAISLQVKMSCEKTIKRVQRIIGGKIYEYNADMPSFQSPAGWNKSTQWGCRVSGKALLEVVDCIAPYMTTKKVHTRVVRSFCNTIGERGTWITPAVQKKRERLHKELTELNKRQIT